MPDQSREKYLSAKELSLALSEIGLGVSTSFVRAMLHAGVPRLGNRAKLSAVLAWWKANPNFVARPRRGGKTAG